MPRLFIADDEEGFRRFVQRVAEGVGWAVTECSDGSELINKLNEHSEPGLILLDMNMPKMDGVETVLNMPEDIHQRPVCLVTGGAISNVITASILSDTRDLAIETVLTKPVAVADLLKLFNEVAARHTSDHFEHSPTMENTSAQPRSRSSA